MNKFIFSITFLLTLHSSLMANPVLKARTGILFDYHSNEILFEQDADIQIYPASMT